MHIGIDLGGTKTEIVLLDQLFKQIYRERLATPQGNYSATLEQICQMIIQVEARFGKATTVGIGIPGSVSKSSGLVKNANSVCLIGKPMQADLRQKLKRHLFIQNDADCFILSESLDGAAESADSAFGVILGTGVGGGLMYKQQLVQGPNGIAGEWGHNPMAINGKVFGGDQQCYCGRVNCIETFLSGPGFEKRYLQETGTALSMPEIATSIGDDSNPFIAIYCQLLAHALGQVINLFDPAVIVLGGGVSNIPALYHQVPSLLPQVVFSDNVETQIVSARHGDSSGVRGAAMLFRWQANCEDGSN